MLVLKAQNLYMEYGQQLVFDIPQLQLHSTDRIGLVGRNGTGKTTLMNVLCGYLEPMGGTVTSFAPLAMIPQLSGDTDGSQILQRQRELWGIPEAAMSGGEKTRLLIARAFGRESGGLFCDEPTSNLDAEGIARLEAELANYEGALVVVSHDRALLDHLCSKIWELQDGKLKIYKGNWTDYNTQREAERKQAWDEYGSYVTERDHLTEAARMARQNSLSVRKTPSRMGNSEARLHRRDSTVISQKLSRSGKAIEKRLERLDVKEKPRETAKVRLNAGDVEGPAARILLEVKDLHFRWPDGPEVLRGVGFVLKRDARLAIQGSNGAGKTTLLNCLAEGAPQIWETTGIQKGFYRQDLSILSDKMTVLENVTDTAIVPVQTVRNMLARVLLPEDSIQKKASVLSGGERAKVALVKLLASDANLLLLDEPTNFLDVYALEGLESMIEQYPGTIVLVSHDRYFVDKVATDRLTLIKGRLMDESMNFAVPETRQEDLTALRLRRDMLLSRISTMKAGEERMKLEEEFNTLNHKLSPS